MSKKLYFPLFCHDLCRGRYTRGVGSNKERLLQIKVVFRITNNHSIHNYIALHFTITTRRRYGAQDGFYWCSLCNWPSVIRLSPVESVEPGWMALAFQLAVIVTHLRHVQCAYVFVTIHSVRCRLSPFLCSYIIVDLEHCPGMISSLGMLLFQHRNTQWIQNFIRNIVASRGLLFWNCFAHSISDLRILGGSVFADLLIFTYEKMSYIR